MKKISMILSLCLICFSLAACDPGPVSHYRSEGVADEVVGIELINYHNQETKIINTIISTRAIRAFDFDKMEIIEELDTEKLGDFLQDFSEVNIWSRWIHPDSPVDISIRIIYDSGDFEVISCVNTDEEVISFLARYNSKGKMVKHIGTVENRSEFVDIVNRYFTTQIK